MSHQPIYHVLALSGGGYRGLYTATVLARLEEELGHPLARHFDLICGTSVGGLLAMGLAAEIPAAALREMFTEKGSTIFAKPSLPRKLLGFWLLAKHKRAGLEAVLTETYGERTIGDLKHRVLVPAVNFSTGRGQFFKTPHHETFRTDYRLKLIEVGLATTAAPVYFPPFKTERAVFVDGGLVGNAPGWFGLHEVNTFLEPNEKPRIRLLSIGTMTIGSTIRGDADLDMGVLKWRGSLFDLVISAQEASVDHMLRQTLKQDYFRIDDQVTPDQSKDVCELDVVSKSATETLTARAMHAAQTALGSEQFSAFTDYIAEAPAFYHGPNKNR